MIMQDSYKELINEVLVIELIDCEVNWIDWYKQINAFCNVKSEEYEYWKDKKILIKDVASKQDTVIDHYTYLKDLSLFITDDNLQDLIRRKNSLNVIANSLGSLFDDDWGRDHEHFGGEHYTYTEKGIVPQNGYFCKFNLQKLFSIIRSGCMIKNEGSSYANNNYNATSFYTSEGEKVYVTAGFLCLLQSIFMLRKNALDVAIQRLTIKPPAPEKIEDRKEIKDILKANDKDRRIGNRFDELMITHKDKKTVLAIMGRQTDLEVGTETSTEKDKTDSIKRTLKKYGIIE